MYNKGKINHGCVIMAEEQTRGRGQRDNNWISNSGENLLLSICIEPHDFSVDKQFDITCFASLSIIYYLKKNGIQATIKWPNDIMVNGKKIAGILIENQLKGRNIKFSNVGIGLNINQLIFSNLKATSISNELSKKININTHLNLLLNEINYVFNTLFYFQKKLRNEYLNNLYQFNKPCKYKTDKKIITGTIKGVTSWGKLIMENENQIIEFDNKEIKFI